MSERSGQTVEAQPSRHPYLVLFAVCAATFTIMLATSSTNVALPSLVVDLSASTRDLQWIVDGYNLTFASFVLAFGSLSDRYGRKGALILGLATFAGAGVVSSQVTTSEQLIGAQAAMGLGAAMIFPTTLSIISNVFTGRAARARAIGVWGALAGMGAGCGPVFGGSLTEWFSWEWIYVGLATVAGVVLLAVALAVPTSRDPSTPRIDLLGLALSVLAMATLVYTVIEAPERGWMHEVTAAGFAGAAVLFVLLVAWELRCREPMLDMRLFTNARFSAASSAVAFSYFALFGFVFLATLYMQFVLGYSPLEAGVRILPVSGALAVGAIAGTLLAMRIGNNLVMTTGLVLFAGSFVWVSTDDASTGYLTILAQLIPMGLGIGFTTAPATESIMGSVSKEKAGIGSAMNDATREFGGTLGVAVIGSVQASIYAEGVVEDSAVSDLPPEARELVTESIGAAQQVAAAAPEAADAILTAATEAFLDGFAVSGLVAAAVTLAGAVVTAVFLPARPTAPEAEEAVEGPLQPAPRSGVAGWVASSGGAILDGATVVLTDLDANVAARGVTVPGQGYWLPAPHGTFVLMASHPGHEPVAEVVTVEGSVVRSHPILPVRPGRLVGTVRAAAGGPVPDALVTVRNPHGAPVARRLTAEDGSFAFDAVDPGDYVLTATGYVAAACEVEISPGEDRQQQLTLQHELPPATSVVSALSGTAAGRSPRREDVGRR